MPKNKNKNKNKSSQQQIEQDMFNNILNTNFPTPNPNTSSPSGPSSQHSNTQAQSQPASFADYAPIITNPFSQQFYHQNPHQAFYPVHPQQASTHFHPQYSQPPQFYTNLMHQHSSTHFQPETQPEAQDSSDEAVDAVPETQPEPQPDPHGKRKQVRWTEEDTKILCERWIHCSENGVIGRNQTEKSFWRQVGNDFNALTNEKRNYSQLNGKWNKIAPDVKKFNSIHKHYTEICPQSGASENDVLVATRKHFAQQENGRKFIYEACWNILKEYPKFFQEPGIMGSSKRGFEPETQPIDVDDETDANEPPRTSTLEFNMRRLFQDDPIRRPPGRKATKKSSESDAATSSRSNSSSKSEAYEAVKMTALAQNEAIQSIKENSKKKLAYKALNFLAKLKKKSKPEKDLLRAARLNVVQEFAPMFPTNETGPSEEAEADDEETESES